MSTLAPSKARVAHVAGNSFSALQINDVSNNLQHCILMAFLFGDPFALGERT